MVRCVEVDEGVDGVVRLCGELRRRWDMVDAVTDLSLGLPGRSKGWSSCGEDGPAMAAFVPDPNSVLGLDFGAASSPRFPRLDRTLSRIRHASMPIISVHP